MGSGIPPLVYLAAAVPLDPAERWSSLDVREVKGWHRWGDAKRLKLLREIAEEHGRDPRLREFVCNEVFAKYGGRPRDFVSQGAAILRWIQQNIRYFNEPNELIETPSYVLRTRIADCDGMAVLGAAMAESVRLPWRFVLGGRRRGRRVRWAEPHRRQRQHPPEGTRFHHIYLDFGDRPFRPPHEQRWRAAEPTIPTAPFGFDAAVEGRPGGGGSLLPELAGEETGAAPFWSQIPWRTLALGVGQAILSAIVIRWLFRSRRSSR